MSNRRKKRQINRNNGLGDGDPFVLMSDILDKLHIINYDKEFLSNNTFVPLTPGYFAYSTNIAEQFGYFQSLCLWLLKYINHSFVDWDDFQDPNSISNNILQECKKLKFTKEFPSTKLRQGFGQETCETLDFLTNIAIKKVNYQIQPPVFHKPKNTNNMNDESEQLQNEDNINNNNNNNNIDEMSDESLVEDIMDDDSDIQKSDDNNEIFDNSVQKNKNYFLSNNNNINEDIDTNINDENEHKTTMSVMETQISSKEWKLELETVSHLLEDRYITGIKEWVTHLKKSKIHGKSLKEIWPDSKAKLLKYANKLSQYLERINAKENQLNREFGDLCEEYQNKYTKLQNLTKEYNEYILEISTLTSNLEEINEKINDVKIEMENRNNSMTDMTPIRRLKEIHNQLKEELTDLDLKIGINRTNLLHA
eukprot:176472_1